MECGSDSREFARVPSQSAPRRIARLVFGTAGRQPSHLEAMMEDLVFAVLTALFFVASLAYVYACERLR